MKTKKRILPRILLTLLALIAAYLLLQYVLLQAELKKADQRLADYQAQTITLPSGQMSYVDKGTGPVILVAHGMSGGYDQAYETLRGKEDSYRILAPSRFGYLGSTLPGDASPEAQAAAYAQLLDALDIEQAFILGTSAGGTPAIRMALDYPERVQGLILYCSASPLTQKPASFAAYQGPPAFMLNDYMMWLFRPLFEPMMGMSPDTIYQMLPISRRSQGMRNDSAVTNPDMARHFDDYPIEQISAPVLIMGAEDDKLVDTAAMVQAAERFPHHEMLIFQDGGHMMRGHEAQIDQALEAFVSTNAGMGEE